MGYGEESKAGGGGPQGTARLLPGEIWDGEQGRGRWRSRRYQVQKSIRSQVSNHEILIW